MIWPTISVIIPSYQQGHFIERTILSIMKQNYAGNIEIIVSDGGSQDNTVSILKKYPEIIWWSLKDKGYSDAVNKGLKVASGDIIAIQSSDDYYLQGAFQDSIAFLMNNKDYGLVTSNDIYLQKDLKTASRSHINNHEITTENLLFVRNIPQHCTFVKREAIDFVGGVRSLVDEGNTDNVSDTDLWYRILHYYKGKFLSRYSAIYQLHDNQRAANIKNDLSNIFERMINTCENNIEYSTKFVLDYEDKQILLDYIRITCTHNNSELRKLHNKIKKNSRYLELIAKIEEQLYVNEKYIYRIVMTLTSNTLNLKIKQKIKDFRHIEFHKKIDISWWEK